MISEEECLFIYTQILALLENEGKIWLVDQVESQFHQGKVRQVENVETVKVRKNNKQPSLKRPRHDSSMGLPTF